MATAIARQQGFSVAEVLLAMALITVTLLALIGVSIFSLSVDRKSRDLVAGQMVAEQAVDRLVYAAESNPAASFWAHEVGLGLYEQQVVTLTPTDYQVTMYVADLGFPAPRRLKQIDCEVTWQGVPQGKVRQGQLRIRASRLIHE